MIEILIIKLIYNFEKRVLFESGMKVYKKGFNVYFCILIGKAACEKFPINVIIYILKKRQICGEIVQNIVSDKTISFITVSKLRTPIAIRRKKVKGGKAPVP